MVGKDKGGEGWIGVKKRWVGYKSPTAGTKMKISPKNSGSFKMSLFPPGLCMYGRRVRVKLIEDRQQA